MQEALAASVEPRLDLARDEQYRRRSKLRLVQARHGVRRPRAGRGQHHTEPAGCAGVTVGGVCCPLLVAHAHDPDAGGTGERFIDRKVVDARDAEHVRHAVSYEACRDGFAASHHGHGPKLAFGGAPWPYVAAASVGRSFSSAIAKPALRRYPSVT